MKPFKSITPSCVTQTARRLLLAPNRRPLSSSSPILHRNCRADICTLCGICGSGLVAAIRAIAASCWIARIVAMRTAQSRRLRRQLDAAPAARLAVIRRKLELRASVACWPCVSSVFLNIAEDHFSGGRPPSVSSAIDITKKRSDRMVCVRRDQVSCRPETLNLKV